MAEIIRAPELRYTSENQMPIAEMLVQFPGLRPEDPPATLKVVGWGNLAQEIQDKYRQGDRVIIEGRLSMNTIEHPEGFKEKRAELTAQRVHPVVADTLLDVSPIGATTSSIANQSSPPDLNRPTPAVKSSVSKFPAKPEPVAEPDFDDIPF